MDTSEPLWKLIQACKLRGVIITRQALDTADGDFGLASEEQLIAFIARGGLERPLFKNECPLEKNTSSEPCTVYAYTFESGSRRGYIAFYSRGGRWVIKSFKNNTDPVKPTRRFER